MTSAVFIMGGLGIFVGICLAIASKVFYVYVDPKIVAVDDALPGANCGGCGYPGCMPNAEAIVAGRSAPNSCVAAGADVAEAVAAIMGVSVEAREPDIARPGCTYGVQDADLKYHYDGVIDCRAVSLLSGGMKVCTIGCLGLGSCARACPFDAIVMGEDNLPVVIEKKCTGCGTCEKICPKHIITLSSVTRRIIREYTTHDCTTPCQRACPAGIDICEYIRLVAAGDYHRSVQMIKERNPFPTVIGRICPRPCENECRRQLVDEPVAINYLKRFVADYEMESGQRIQPFKAPDSGHKIAVVGGGVQGLSTAFFAARLGHELTVFEATAELGGLLRSAIARNRLPLDVLDWDIEGIMELGVEAQTGQTLGSDFTVDTLLGQGFQAVFLASGGWDSRLSRGSRAKAENPVPGTRLLIDLLKLKENELDAIACGDEVVIAGGGALTAQAVERCQKMGVKRITVIFREPEQQRPWGTADIEGLRQQGVRLIFNTGIQRLRGKGSKLTQLDIVNLDSGHGERLSLQTLFVAAGRFPQLIFVQADSPAEESEEGETSTSPIGWEAFEPYKLPAFKDEIGLMAQGDELSDFSGAIRAIGAGRRAAASIHQTIYDIPLTLPESVLTPKSIVQDLDRVERVAPDKRRIMPLSESTDPQAGEELEKGFNEQMAKAEAERCLRCGLICYQHTQLTVEQTVSAAAEKTAYI